MTQAERIIGRFGGLSKLARALGHNHPTTVQGWKERGFIPADMHETVLNKARALRIPMSADDFVRPGDTRAAERLRKKAA